MFSIPRANVIQSDEGFAVEVLGRVGLLYTEGRRTVHLDSEVINGPHGLVLYTSSIRQWDPPNSGESINAAERDRIVQNIRAAFRFRAIEIDVL
jgi:hypothetical protein